MHLHRYAYLGLRVGRSGLGPGDADRGGAGEGESHFGVSLPSEVGEELPRHSSGRVLCYWDLGSAIGHQTPASLDGSSVSGRHSVATATPE